MSINNGLRLCIDSFIRERDDSLATVIDRRYSSGP
jgi:hypothetical protein